MKDFKKFSLFTPMRYIWSNKEVQSPSKESDKKGKKE